MYLSQNSHALNYATHTFQVSPQCQAALSQERDIRNHVIHLKKNKTRHKINFYFFVLLKIFNVSGFLNNQNNLR